MLNAQNRSFGRCIRCGKAAVVIIDGQTSIHALVDLDASTCITEAISIGLNLDAVLLEAQCVIHAHSAPIFKSEHRLKIDTRWRLSIDNARLLRRHGKSSVIAW